MFSSSRYRQMPNSDGKMLGMMPWLKTWIRRAPVPAMDGRHIHLLDRFRE